MNVFDITIEHAALIAEIEDLGGEITPELATRLNINEKDLATKVRAYYHIIKTAESQITLAKEEQERLANVRKSKENLIKRLKTTVDIAVEEFGVVKKDGKVKSLDLGDLKVWQKKTEALDLVEDAVIDDERFSKKVYIFNLNYEEAAILENIINDDNNPPLSYVKTIVPIKDKLKEWLINNEEYLKILKDEAEDIAIGIEKFDEENQVEYIRTTFSQAQEDINKQLEQKEADLKLALTASIAHNSTVVFK